MTRSKFLIEMEEYFYQKYGKDWAQGEVSWEEVTGAFLDLQVTNKGIQ